MKQLFYLFILALCQLANAQKSVTTYYDWNKIHPRQKYTVNAAGQTTGSYIEYDEKGVVVREYNYLNGEKNGLCVDYLATGNGQRHAMNKITYKNGVLDGYYLENCIINTGGFSQHQVFRGKKEEGQYKDGKKTGAWKEWWCLEEVPGTQSETFGTLKSAGNYDAEGQQTGMWNFYTEKGWQQTKGTFARGKRSGKWALYDDKDSGRIVVSWVYIDGKRIGSTKIFVDAGGEETEYLSKATAYREIAFDSTGIPVGKETDYFITGEKLWEGQMLSVFPDERTGLCITYWKNGNKMEEANYISDKAYGIYKLYYENGQLKQDANMKNGLLEGFCKTYYENGAVKFEGNYLKDKPDGECKGYYQSGTLKYIEIYKRELQSGKYYNESGQLTREYPGY